MAEEMPAKFAKLGALYAALARAKEDKDGPDKALAVQDLNQQIRNLRGTFPKLSLVN